MKKLIVILVVILTMPLFANADRWCEWSGTQGVNCKNDTGGVLYSPDGKPTRTESIINAFGYYRVTTTQPTIGIDQTKDAEVWDKVDNQISLTWTVRDMTDEEIDQIIANPMSTTDYYIWKTLLVTGVITQEQAINNLPSEMIDAYQARKRLLGD